MPSSPQLTPQSRQEPLLLTAMACCVSTASLRATVEAETRIPLGHPELSGGEVRDRSDSVE